MVDSLRVRLVKSQGVPVSAQVQMINLLKAKNGGKRL
jgi:hypothetical protein